VAVRRNGIALVGFMGAGKSTVGRHLAQQLGWPFVDTDEVLAGRYGPVHEQITREGLGVFREREKELALSLCDGVARVLATGGGTLLDATVREELPRHYGLVLLDVPLEVAARRVEGDGSRPRPLWDEGVAQRYEERRGLYQMAELRLDATEPVQALVEEIVAWRRR
jgi:shikimate kinase